jgi:hypothetical protein
MTTPKRGNCGTCHWFEPEGQAPTNGQPWAGLCLANPPVAAQTMVPSGLGPHGPMMRPAIQGMVPPTNDNRRCAQWRPAGMLPDLALEFANAG